MIEADQFVWTVTTSSGTVVEDGNTCSGWSSDGQETLGGKGATWTFVSTAESSR